jgi:hypothetical protein
MLDSGNLSKVILQSSSVRRFEHRLNLRPGNFYREIEMEIYRFVQSNPKQQWSYLISREISVADGLGLVLRIFLEKEHYFQSKCVILEFKEE